MLFHILRCVTRVAFLALVAAMSVAAGTLPARAALPPANALVPTPTLRETLQTFALRPGIDTAVDIHTLPGARCTIANPKAQSFVFFADGDGIARIHVRPPAGPSGSVNLTPICAAGTVAAAAPLTMRVDPRAIAPRLSTIPASAVRQTVGLRGLDVLHASEAELARYGYPPRPRQPQTTGAFNAWLQAVTTSMYRMPKAVERPEFSMGPARRRAAIRNGLSTIWSGYTIYGFDSPYTAVTGRWKVPSVTMPQPNVPGYSALWAGIDGEFEGDVVQAGTLQTAYNACPPPIEGVPQPCFLYREYWAWYEFFPDDSREVFLVNPADDIYTESWVTFDGSGIAYGNFFVADLTTNQWSETSERMPTYDPTYPHFDGTTAEWIMERPELNGVASELADYGQATLTAALAVQQNGNAPYYTAATNETITLSNNGHLLSAPSSIDYETMRFTWFNPI